MSFGENVKRARKALDLSQQQLADKLGVTDKAVSGWERDVDWPEAKKIPLLAKALNRTIAWLFDEKGNFGDLPEPDRKILEMLQPHDLEERERARRMLKAYLDQP